MRRTFATATVALTLVVAGCTDRAQDEVDLPSLRTKLHALTADPCHSDPRAQPPSGCEKYVTQLGNTARTVTLAAQGNPALKDPGVRMTRGVNAYRKGGCKSKQPRSERDCYAALNAIAEAVEDVENELEE